jgi:hypothetical protein
MTTTTTEDTTTITVDVQIDGILYRAELDLGTNGVKVSNDATGDMEPLGEEEGGDEGTWHRGRITGLDCSVGEDVIDALEDAIQEEVEDLGEENERYTLTGYAGEDGVQCECGQITGVRCTWVGSPTETAIVEWMPQSLRASHEAAGNHGSYPHNGSIRVRCEKSCADGLVDDDPDWTRIVSADEADENFIRR